jgi:rhamnogalacturonyl hydrolase YesR
MEAMATGPWMAAALALVPTGTGCVPGAPVPATPATLETADLAGRLFDKAAARWPADDLSWDWIQTVWAWGALAWGGHDAAGTEYARDWIAAHLSDFEGESPRQFRSSDSLSPSSVACEAARRAGSAGESLDVSAVVAEAEDYLASAPRAGNGALAHWGADNPLGLPTDQVWVDSQFMVGMYLICMGNQELAGPDQARFLAERALARDLLRDPAASLWVHAWDDAAGATIPAEPGFWLRGNAWALLVAATALGTLADGDPAREGLAAELVAQADALRETQIPGEPGASGGGGDPDAGLLRTLVDVSEPASYAETSGSALVAVGWMRAQDAGALPAGGEWDRAIARAVHGLQARVEDRDGDPVIVGTSVGTNPGEIEDYLAVPQLDDLMLGYGAVIWALSEADGRADPDALAEDSP